MQKIQDLENIQYQVSYYFQRKSTIPVSLNDLNDPLSGYIVPVDPQSKEQYDYKVLSKNSFELCTEFNLEDDKNKNWIHGIGNTCFERTVDPQKYPPISKF
jgi:hypothetical protein